MNLKQARQDVADIKAQGSTLLASIKARDGRPTAEESAQLGTIEQNLTAAESRLAEAERLADLERRLGTAVPASSVAVGPDRAAERTWGPVLHSDATTEMKAEARLAALGEFAIAVKNAASGAGVDTRLMAAAAGMNTTTGADGGFAVPVDVAAGIEREMYEVGSILSRCDVRTISGDAITYTTIDETSRVDGSRQGGILGYWVDQGTAPTASQTKLARVEMKLRKVGALGYMTDELVSDAAALGGELAAMFTDELVFQVENAIWRGNGAGQPLGFTVAPCLVTVSKESNQTADTINASNLVKMWARVPASSKRVGNGLAWFVNTDALPQLNTLAFPTASTDVAARFVNFGPDGVMTIFGRPVVEVEYAATIGDAGDIALADLSKYRLIRKGGVEQASSIHVRFTTGEQTFRAFYRVDGQPMPRAAVTPFKGSNTKSPFVVLEAR